MSKSATSRRDGRSMRPAFLSRDSWRLTVSIVVIMFELTGALSYVLPIMIAVMLSKWVGDAFGTRGIYETWIHYNEYPFLDNRDDSPLPDVPVSQIMTTLPDLVVLTAKGYTMASLQDFLATNSFRGFPVVTDTLTNTLLGYISRTELHFSLQAAKTRKLPPETEVFFTHQHGADQTNTLDLRPWMDQTPITLNTKSSLQLTVSMFSRLGLRYVLFTDRGALQGILTKKDVWFILDRASDGESRSEGTGMLREERTGESRGLLRGDIDGDRDSMSSPIEER